MNQGDLLRFVLDKLEGLDVPHMVVGSFASGAYGEPRLTQDIDVVIDPTPGQLGQLCASFPADDFYVSVDAAQVALRQGGQFNVIHPESGNKIDFVIARRDAWGREEMARRSRCLLLPDREAYTARPEDVILSKMLSYAEGGSEKHLRDIAGILRVHSVDMDRDYISRWSDELGVAAVWDAILRRLGGQ